MREQALELKEQVQEGREKFQELQQEDWRWSNQQDAGVDVRKPKRKITYG